MGAARLSLPDDRSKTMIGKLLAVTLLLGATGCAGMTDTQQRAATGTMGGAAGGALIGAIAGNAGLGAGIGAGVGLLGGLLVDKAKKDQDAAYRAGYSAGQGR
jgi:hypothetical protein